MSEHNAAGTRVAVRPLWLVFMLLFLTGGLYRVYLAWRTAADIASFGREDGGRIPEQARLRPNPSMFAFAAFVLFVGAGMFLYGVLLALVEVPSEYGPPPATSDVIVLIAIGATGVAVGIAYLLRLAALVRAARTLAGLPERTRVTSRPVIALSMVAELFAVPTTTFALQAALNDLWSRYPPLLDEDLHGEFAPPDQRDAAIAERPRLHDERLAHIATDLEHPRLVPWVTITFAALCVAVFAWQLWEHGPFPTAEDLERVGGLRSGLDGQWWRFWTANVLHGSIEHLTGNMFAWVLVASMAERVVGHLRMVVLVIAGAAGCSIGALQVDPDVVGIGASGVVFAAFGLAAMADPLARRPVGKVGWSLVALGLGLSTFAPGVSSGGHVGGVVAGFVVGALVAVAWRVPRPDPTLDRSANREALVDPAAPLAPNRALSIAERLAHLDRRLEGGELTPLDHARLRNALVTRG